MPQERRRAQGAGAAQERDERHEAPECPQERIDELDAVLDDIESVLETNAEEYVNGFVQKGGQ